MPLHPDTLAVTSGRPPREPGAPLNAPPLPASTYHAGGDVIYGRDGNAGWQAFEDALGALEGGHAVAFASGIAAAAAVFDELPAGAVVVAPRTPYYGVITLLREHNANGRLELREVESLTAAALQDAAAGAALVWAETPTNPMLDIVDIEAVAAVARGHGALLTVDNTFATPLLQSPLRLGADLAIHSVTKYVGGHSDLLMGAVAASDPAWADRLRARRSRSGATPGTLEAFLALRGLRSLPVRLERCQESAAELARRLAAHPAVARVRDPGDPQHPNRDLVRRQMSGGGAMISFETRGSAHDADAVCARCELVVHATSLGGVESSMERRATHAAEREAGTPPTLIRLSVGLEHVEDIWRDLDSALGAITR